MFYKVSTETINNHDVQQLGLVTARLHMEQTLFGIF